MFQILILNLLIIFSCENFEKKNTTKITEVSPNKYQKQIDTNEINHLLGKFDYKKDSSFIFVESKYASKSMYLRKETYAKFIEMYDAAKKEGVTLTIISGTRNFYEQKEIWNRKWEKNIVSMDSLAAAKKILLYSSMPCTSRHHWGTDMDLIDLNNSYFDSGIGLKAYKWLNENAIKYGFCQVYDDKKITKRTGYELEKWHWSYMPLSSKYLKRYNELINYSMINGFKGSNLAKKIDPIELYVNGINKSCQ
jgi:LAS superfamily LD-carboxypeptidase LdcB